MSNWNCSAPPVENFVFITIPSKNHSSNCNAIIRITTEKTFADSSASRLCRLFTNSWNISLADADSMNVSFVSSWFMVGHASCRYSRDLPLTSSTTRPDSSFTSVRCQWSSSSIVLSNTELISSAFGPYRAACRCR